MVSLYQNMKLHFTLIVFKLLSSNCIHFLLKAASKGGLSSADIAFYTLTKSLQEKYI